FRRGNGVPSRCAAVLRRRRHGGQPRDRAGQRWVHLMPIIVRLDVMLAKRRIRSKALAQAVGITEANLSHLKSGKVNGVRFTTLAAICRYLNCQPGDLLEYVPDDADSIDVQEAG